MVNCEPQNIECRITLKTWPKGRTAEVKGKSGNPCPVIRWRRRGGGLMDDRRLRAKVKRWTLNIQRWTSNVERTSRSERRTRGEGRSLATKTRSFLPRKSTEWHGKGWRCRIEAEKRIRLKGCKVKGKPWTSNRLYTFRPKVLILITTRSESLHQQLLNAFFKRGYQ